MFSYPDNKNVFFTTMYQCDEANESLQVGVIKTGVYTVHDGHGIANKGCRTHDFGLVL